MATAISSWLWYPQAAPNIKRVDFTNGFALPVDCSRMLRLETQIASAVVSKFLTFLISLHQKSSYSLPLTTVIVTLKAPSKNASENVVCRSRLLQIIAEHYCQIQYRSKQRGPRTDCSYRSSLEQSDLVHTVCHRDF